MKAFFAKHLYSLLSLLLLTSSLFGALFLVNQTQDIRNRAEESCRPVGAESCQENSSGGNTGYLCKCTAWSEWEQSYGYWDCNTENTTKCPTTSGPPAPSGSITCRRDNPSLCPNTHSSNPNFEAMVGMYVGFPDSCNFYDACGTPLTEGQSCVGLSRLSDGEPYNGAFVGCSGLKNCFCDLDFSGTVRCLDDVNNDSCGARAVTATPTRPPATATTRPSPTPTTRPSVTPTTRPSATPTIRPSSTPTPTTKPSSTPTPTNTPTTTPQPTATSTPLPTATMTPNPSATTTPQPTATNTPLPTSTIVPTQVIAQGPSPTQIILPQAGLDFPVKTLAIIGTIVSLLGFLILL